VRRPAETGLVFAALLAGLFATLLVTRYDTLHGTDECREAGIAREMADSGDFVVPRLGGRPFLEKPPLFYAAAAVCVRALGPTERAVRLAAGLFAVAAVVFTGLAARRLGGGWLAGAIAALALGTTLAFQEGPFESVWRGAAHHCVTNIAVAATAALGFFAFERLAAGGRRAHLDAALFYAAVGLGFLAKNAYGAALPLAGAAAYVVAARDRRVLGRLFLTPGWLVGLGLAGGWTLALYAAGERDGGRGLAYLREVLIDNTIGRFAEGYGGHVGSAWWEVPGWLLAALAPWAPLGVIALAHAARQAFAAPDADERRGALVTLAFALAPLALVAFSRSKRPVYMVTLLPPFAAAIGAWWAAIDRDPARRLERGLAAAAALLAPGLPLVAAWAGVQARGGIGVPEIIFAAAALGLFASAARLVRRGTAGRLGAVASAGALCFAAAPLDGAIARARDTLGEGPFHREVAALLAPGEVGTVGYGERELGSASFYLGRAMTPLDGRSAAETLAFLTRPGTAGLLFCAKGRAADLLDAAAAAAAVLGPEGAARARLRWVGFSPKRCLLLVVAGSADGDEPPSAPAGEPEGPLRRSP
jgi:4-amino-4-deoxy-L-arabinose transferase-like glycosyltransferase